MKSNDTKTIGVFTPPLNAEAPAQRHGALAVDGARFFATIEKLHGADDYWHHRSLNHLFSLLWEVLSWNLNGALQFCVSTLRYHHCAAFPQFPIGCGGGTAVVYKPQLGIEPPHSTDMDLSKPSVKSDAITTSNEMAAILFISIDGVKVMPRSAGD